MKLATMSTVGIQATIIVGMFDCMVPFICQLRRSAIHGNRARIIHSCYRLRHFRICHEPAEGMSHESTGFGAAVGSLSPKLTIRPETEPCSEDSVMEFQLPFTLESI